MFVGDIYDGGTSIVEGYLRSSEIDGVIGNLFVFSAKKVFEKSSSKVYGCGYSCREFERAFVLRNITERIRTRVDGPTGLDMSSYCSCWGNIEGNLDIVHITTQRYNLLQSFLFDNNLYLPIKTVIIIAYRDAKTLR